ncbi:hypothetical protein LS72_004575 [Helicobacter apodemus]|uniref:Uncharacterized protein n=1 Tax=Helicobacter apodemus TaxID=135569 RepID=A0A4U8UE33_9HELI|nr:hypothetical protein [Helicobacter apodemus]TLE16177.1 hypothetical protein LS72_004575 [Helicobacter apodemus]
MTLQVEISNQNKEQIINAIKLIKGVKQVQEIPNAATLKALKESDAIARQIKLHQKKPYANWEEAKKAILNVSN